MREDSRIECCLQQHKMTYRVAPYKEIQDSPGLWIPCRRFQIPATGFRILCQWNLDSGFQNAGFRIPQEQFPGFRNSEATQRLLTEFRLLLYNIFSHTSPMQEPLWLLSNSNICRGKNYWLCVLNTLNKIIIYNLHLLHKQDYCTGMFVPFRWDIPRSPHPVSEVSPWVSDIFK